MSRWKCRCSRLALLTWVACSPAAAAAPFYMGADISLQTFMQQQNVTFTDNGVAKPLDTLLYDRGANLFRLRLFVNPQTIYTNTNVGAIQDLSYTIALAQQIRSHAPGARLLLDFHYSDTWADPGNQAMPAAWSGQSLPQLESTLRNYTRDTLLAFKSAGVLPEMVQVGNEIQSGMLFNTGRLNFNGTTAQRQASWQTFGRLVNASIAGVREAQDADSPITVAIHPGQDDVASFFFQNLTHPAWGNVPTSSFDLLGVSYYPTDANRLANLRNNLTALINTYDKDVIVLETNAPWRNANAPANDPNYPNTPEGQLAYLTDLRDTLRSLPGGHGAGLVYWYPEAVQVPGFNIYNGGATALFDTNRRALPALAAFSIPEPAQLAPLAASLLLLRRHRQRVAISKG